MAESEPVVGYPLDHKFGYRVATCVKIIRERGMNPDDFHKWMSGQTGTIDESGRMIVYHWDLTRFLNRGGRNAPVWD